MTPSRRIAEALARGWAQYRRSVLQWYIGEDGNGWTTRWVHEGIEARGTCAKHGWYRAVFSLTPYPVDGVTIGCPECVALLPPPRRYA